MKRPGKGELSLEVDAKLSREPKVRHCLIEKCYIRLDNRKLKNLFNISTSCLIIELHNHILYCTLKHIILNKNDQQVASYEYILRFNELEKLSSWANK